MHSMKPIRLSTIAHFTLLSLLYACGSEEPNAFELRLGVKRTALSLDAADLGRDADSFQSLYEDSEGRIFPIALTRDQAIVSSARSISGQERAAWNELHAARIDLNPPIAPRATDDALEYAASRPPDERIPLTIILEDPEFDFRRFGVLKTIEVQEDRDFLRAELITERQRQLHHANQGIVSERLVGLGAEITHVFWIDDSLNADVPARAVSEIATWPELAEIYYEDPATYPKPQSSGLDIRSQVLIGNFHAAGYRGHDGQNGTLATIKIAIIESQSQGANFLNRSHDGFRHSFLNTSSRVDISEDCTSAACVNTTSESFSSSHATKVAWTFAGSIEEEQDSSYPGSPSTNDQKKRSGIATDTVIQMYYTNTIADEKKALQRAIVNDADIVNISAGSATRECQDMAVPESYDVSGFNAALRDAMNANILVVKSAGNYENVGDTCSASYPSWRPHVLSAGAVFTPNSTTLDDAFLWYQNGPNSPDGEGITNDEFGSGRGHVPYVYAGNRVLEAHPTVGLVAPGSIEYHFTGTSSYTSSTTDTGTSIAAPMVAGGAALLKHAFVNVGVPNWSADVKILLTNMLLMGNGWWVSGSNNWGLEAGGMSQNASRASGFGKLRMHYPYDNTLGSPRSWATATVNLTNGGAVAAIKVYANSSGVNQPLPSTVTQLKWSAAWFPNELTDNGSIGAEIFSASCSSQTPWTTGTLLAYDWYGSSRIRIQLEGSAIANKCIFLVLKPYFTPGGGTVTVYNAFYWHAGSTGVH